jgi:glycosyltransferase involved in cell wall biosynthesis
MNTPEISVVMPAYNAALYINEAIHSVLNQSFTSWELIVVDDGSTDNTAGTVKTFLADPRITLISQTNKGVSAARNAGINAAKGRYIAFLDADDAFLTENLKTKYEAINAEPGIAYVYSDIMLCDADLKDNLIEKGVPADKVLAASLTWQPESIPGFSSNIMVKYAAIKDKDIYFDSHLSNCADRYYKIILTSRCQGAYIPQALAKYRNTPGSMSKKVSLLEHDELYILEKIKEQNIIPAGKKRREVFAKVYLILSGSWYKDAGKTGKAIKFAFKAFYSDPSVCFKLLKKGVALASR